MKAWFAPISTARRCAKKRKIKERRHSSGNQAEAR
jgi:hypothetical protein